MRETQVTGDLIVELGSGSGRLARELVDGGYRVVGTDLSQGMVDLAYALVPEARFDCVSLYNFEIPSCDAVVSIGECLNYVGKVGELPAWELLFRRVHKALREPGVFVFDVAEPGQASEEPATSWREGDGWVVLVRKQEVDGWLTREIVTFRRFGENWQRDGETHYQALPDRTEIGRMLLLAGFEFETSESYGDYPLAPRHVAFFCRRSGVALPP